MRVTDASGRTWLIVRRFAPWRRIVQPVYLCIGQYRRYKATPVRPTPRHVAKRRGAKEERPNIAEQVLDFVLMVVLQPWMIFIMLYFLLLLPLAGLEAILRGAAGAALWPLRRSGLVRVRIDVVASYPDKWGYPSLTVLAAPGPAYADVLERELRELLDQAPRAFDPKHDPAALRLLAETGAEIRRHKSFLVAA